MDVEVADEVDLTVEVVELEVADDFVVVKVELHGRH